MEMLFIFVLGLITASFVFGRRAAPPPIIYRVTPESSPAQGPGCLPIILFSILTIIILKALVSTL